MPVAHRSHYPAVKLSESACERKRAETHHFFSFSEANERHLDHVLREYSQYYYRARPHQGLQQRISEGTISNQDKLQCSDETSWVDLSTLLSRSGVVLLKLYWKEFSPITSEQGAQFRLTLELQPLIKLGIVRPRGFNPDGALPLRWGLSARRSHGTLRRHQCQPRQQPGADPDKHPT
jgi:hypothetical protein